MHDFFSFLVILKLCLPYHINRHNKNIYKTRMQSKAALLRTNKHYEPATVSCEQVSLSSCHCSVNCGSVALLNNKFRRERIFSFCRRNAVNTPGLLEVLNPWLFSMILFMRNCAIGQTQAFNLNAISRQCRHKIRLCLQR